MGKFVDAYKKVRAAYEESGWKQAFKVCRADFWCRVCMETTIPTIFGIGWAAFALWTSQGWYAAISGFGIAFMFTMSLQAQPFRIEKNVQDAQDAEEFRDSLSSIKTNLQELRSLRVTIASRDRFGIESPATNAIAYEPARRLFEDADEMLRSGMSYDATVIGYLAYEWALQDFATQLSVEWGFRSIVTIMGDIAKKLRLDRKGWDLLNDLRNNYVHAHFEEERANKPVTNELATTLVESFKEGIRYLQDARSALR